MHIAKREKLCLRSPGKKMKHRFFRSKYPKIGAFASFQSKSHATFANNSTSLNSLLQTTSTSSSWSSLSSHDHTQNSIRESLRVMNSLILSHALVCVRTQHTLCPVSQLCMASDMKSVLWTAKLYVILSLPPFPI